MWNRTIGQKNRSNNFLNPLNENSSIALNQDLILATNEPTLDNTEPPILDKDLEITHLKQELRLLKGAHERLVNKFKELSNSLNQDGGQKSVREQKFNDVLKDVSVIMSESME